MTDTGKDDDKTEETSESSTDTINQLMREVEKYKTTINESPAKLSGKIGISFLIPGCILLISSILDLDVLLSQTPLAPIGHSITKNPATLVFIGLGLVFWGALFLLVRPTSYIKSNLLSATAISTYLTIDRIQKDLKYNSKSYYIPPYPKEVYLPEHLKGLKEMIVFISAINDTDIPSIEEIAESRFFIKKPNGVLVAPPGEGLMDQLERELRMNFAKIRTYDLCDVLPKLIVEDLQLAREVIMEAEENQVTLQIKDSIFKSLYQEINLKSVYLLGSPLESAIACALAKSSGKPVTIQEIKLEADTINVSYLITEV